MNALKNVYLELSSKCVCACPKCPRTILKGLYQERDLPISHIKQILDAGPTHVSLLGNLGDPIYHDQFPEVIQLMHTYNQAFTVYTVGSGYGESWWRDVYNSYDNEHSSWVFSVDGTKASAGVYRKGLNFDQSFLAMKTGAELNKKISWQYIVFSHNQEYIVEAKQLAKQLGITLRIDFNEKWDGDSDHWKPTKSKSQLGI